MKRVLVLILALLFLCSCAAAPKTGRVSEEELAKLREEYPYFDALNPSAMYSAEALERWKDPHALIPYQEEIDGNALVLVEIKSAPYYTADWHFPHLLPEKYQKNGLRKPFQNLEDLMSIYPELDEDIAYGIAHGSNFCYLDTEVSQVIWGNCGLKKGSNVRLIFGSFRAPDVPEAYLTGNRVLCFLSAYETDNIPLSKTYTTDKTVSWHLTEEDVVLSVSSNYGADSFSGLYLESFKQEVLAILNEE